MASERKTIEELAHRMERGEFEAVGMMEAIGLQMPRRGKFQFGEIERLPKSESDIKRKRQRYRLELAWFHKPDRIDDVFFAVMAVNRGAVRIHEIGVVRPD